MKAVGGSLKIFGRMSSFYKDFKYENE
jgi:hypothetical protein